MDFEDENLATTDTGAQWLGVTFVEEILNDDPSKLTVKMVIEGLLNEQEIWNPQVLDGQSDKLVRNMVLEKQREAWKQIFLFLDIKDSDL